MSDAERIRARQRFQHVWLPAVLVDPFRKCPHERQRGIYGDEIIAAHYKRARCLDCGRLLPNLPPSVPSGEGEQE
jgi:hypothetical protein